MKSDIPKSKSVLTQLAIAGSAACFADITTFPFDTAKVRLQLQGESTGPVNHGVGTQNTKNLLNIAAKQPLVNGTNNALKATGRGFVSTAVSVPAPEMITAADKAAKFQYRGLFGTLCTIAKQEGPRSLYNGLSAGLQRQLVFASVRLGMYDSVKAFYQDLLNERPEDLNVLGRVCAGLTTGAMAVMVGQPTEVVKVRFQAQKRLPGVPLQFTSTPATYRKIGREEGVRGLWKVNIIIKFKIFSFVKLFFYYNTRELHQISDAMPSSPYLKSYAMTSLRTVL